MKHAEVTIKVADMPEVVRVLEAATELAAGVKSFIGSLPYTAPEAVGFQARLKLQEPLESYIEALGGAAS